MNDAEFTSQTMDASSAPRLRLDLLGRQRIMLDQAPLSGFVSNKSIALLAYLAVTKTSHSRESLAGLFWGDSTESDARASLRVVLTNLRQTVGPEHLKTSRRSVALDFTVPIWIDVHEFERLAHGLDGSPAEVAEGHRRALSLYRGELLHELSVNQAAGFEGWLTTQREHYRWLYIQLLDGLAEYETELGNDTEAIEYLGRLVREDPWREEAHRRLMRLYATNGRRNAALQQFERCRQLIHDELGADPEPETWELHESILNGELSQPAPRRKTIVVETPSSHLQDSWRPIEPQTTFIGRERELTQIIDCLMGSGCRLLTLAGPGGIGKSRLALQVMSDRRIQFQHGAHLIALASMSQPNLLVSTIANALGVDVRSSSNQIDHLVHHLHDKRMLLVLDNFEHLVDSSPLLNQILKGAPMVKILVTSRERLALQAEWLVTIHGLPIPTTLDSVEFDNSAIRLFVDRARQAQPQFTLNDGNYPAIARICQILEGMPLGIELAAAWVRTHTIEGIETKIRDNLDFLSSSLRDLPERHRSLKAVFMHSYALLDRRCQAILQALSVFRGGFSATTAEAVVGAMASDLMLLIDKSLIYTEESGRYSMHELIRQYAFSELQSSPIADEAHRRHATFFVELLESAEGALKQPGGISIQSAIQAEIDNIRVAWQWAIEHRDYDLLNRALDGLQLHFEIAGRTGEGLEMLEAVNVPKPSSSAPLQQQELAKATLYARIISWKARWFRLTGLFHDAQELIDEAMAVRDHHGLSFPIAYELDTRTRIANALGRHDVASQLLPQVLAEAEASDDLLNKAFAYKSHGGSAYDAGRLIESRRWFRKAMRARRELGDWDGVAIELHRLGEIDRDLGKFQDARMHKEEALAILRERGNSDNLHYLLRSMGELDQDEGRLDDAQIMLDRAHAVVHRFRTVRTTALVALNQAIAFQSYLTGDLTRAHERAEETLGISRNHGLLLSMLKNLELLAMIQEVQRDWPAARSYALEAIQLANAGNKRFHENRARTILGRVAIGMGKLDEAAELLEAAHTYLTEIKARPAALDVIPGLAALHVARAERSTNDQQLANAHLIQAAEILALALDDAATWFETRQRAAALRADVAASLDQEQLDTAIQRGQQRQLSSVLATVG